MKKILDKSVINGILRIMMVCLALAVFLIVPKRVILAQTATMTPSSSPVSLSLQPNAKAIQVNDTLDVDLIFSASRNRVLGLSFEADFDKTKLNLTGFDPQSNIGFTASSPVISNSVGFFQYSAIGDMSNVASGDVKLGTLHFKAVALTDAGKPIGVAFSNIIAGSADNPLLTVDPNQANLGGSYTINPTQATASYRVSNAPFQKNDSKPDWQPYTSTIIDISGYFQNLNQGQSVTVWYQFKDNSAAQNTSDVKQATIKYIGPDPAIENVVCGFDSSTGVGSRIEITGRNFGQQGNGSVSVVGQTQSNATILSWGQFLEQDTPGASGNSPIPTLTVTPIATPSSTPTPAGSAPTATPTVPLPTDTPTGSAPTNTPIPTQTTSLFGQSRVAGAAATMKDKVVAKVKDRLDGQVNVTLTTDDGRQVSKPCSVNTNTVTFTAKIQCKPPANFASDNVRVQIYENVADAKSLYDSKTKPISLDKDGQPQWTPPPLEINKTYEMVIKAPNTLAIKKEFTVQAGTTDANSGDDINLPVGDIAPLGSPDGVVNAVDKAELFREWAALSDVSRVGDFNMDGRINSIDYSCLRDSINKNGDKFIKN